MGATVFDAARVKTWRTNDGRVAYLWEEKTHCIKDGPKHSSWCAMAFGTKADMVRRIYALASSIPGGMLKVGGRSETAFVDAMLKLLESPEEFPSSKVLLRNESKGFYAAINDENRVAIRRCLAEIGRHDLAQKILDPQSKPTHVELSLTADFDALKAIINDVEYDHLDINDRPSRGKGVNVWKVFDNPWSAGGCGPTEETIPQSQKPRLDLRIYRTNINMAYSGSRTEEVAHVATLNDDTIWIGQANCYSLPDRLIKAAGIIHVCTGHKLLRPLLKEMEAGFRNPRSLDANARFVFTKDDSKWFAENLDEVSSKLGRPVGSVLEASAQELATISHPPFHQLRYLLTSSVERARLVITGFDEECCSSPQLF